MKIELVKIDDLELDPKYVDVIIARWKKFTGLTAELIKE